MARLVTCVCGRRFHIGHGKAGIQCRGCGRWWSGQEIGIFEGVFVLLTGGEIAGTKTKKGDRPASRDNNCRQRQTGKRRPAANPIVSFFRWMTG